MTMRGFGHGAYINGMFLYQENGTVYEFFSGYELGRAEKHRDSVRLVGQVLPTIVFGNELTESQFAYDIKSHMRDKGYLAKIMRHYFDLCREAYVARKKREAQEEAKRQARENCDASWLRSYKP